MNFISKLFRSKKDENMEFFKFLCTSGTAELNQLLHYVGIHSQANFKEAILVQLIFVSNYYLWVYKYNSPTPEDKKDIQVLVLETLKSLTTDSKTYCEGELTHEDIDKMVKLFVIREQEYLPKFVNDYNNSISPQGKRLSRAFPELSKSFLQHLLQPPPRPDEALSKISAYLAFFEFKVHAILYDK